MTNFLTTFLSVDGSAWLFEQAPVIVVMGVVIYWLANRLVKAETEKEELAKEVIKLITVWEEKGKELGDNDKTTKQEIITLLHEIRGILKQKI